MAPETDRSDGETELLAPGAVSGELPCDVPPDCWEGFLRYLSGSESQVYWAVVSSSWRVRAASRSMQARILAGRGDDFLACVTESTAADLRDRMRWNVLANTTIELLHPSDDGTHMASYTFVEIDDGMLLVGRDESQQLQLVSEMSVLVQSLESEMVRERELGENLQTQLSLDHLTGVCSRRHAEDVLRSRWDRMLDGGEPFSVMMIDVDHFKSVNDRYGHDIGDEVLKAVANAIRSGTRESDTVARFGGEEFVVVTPVFDESTLRTMAERVRVRVESCELQRVDSVTISIGLAIADPRAGSVFEILKRSDSALYRAKESGRNRVELADCGGDLPGAGR